MAKVKKPDFEKINKLKPPLIYTRKKLDSDFDHIVRVIKLKPKRIKNRKK